MYFSSMTTEVLISDVEIIWMLMPSSLSEEGINIQMISTSEIKTSVVIDEKYMELAVRALHKAFDLDQ